MAKFTFRTVALASLLTLSGIGLAQAQEAAAPDPGLVVAKLNGQDITRQDILNIAEGMRPEIRANIDQVFPQLLDYYVFLQLAAEKGRADGLMEDTKVKETIAKNLKTLEDNAVREAYLNREIVEKVTEATVDARFNEEKAKFEEATKSLPAEREVSAAHILVKTEEEAKAIIDQLKGGADFATLAKEKSIDPSAAKNAGELGWFGADSGFVKEFADAALAMKKGETSTAPVKTQFGYHVIRLNDEREKAKPTFTVSKDEIRASMIDEMRLQLAKDLKEGAQLEIIDPTGGAKPQQ
jgi:peptidyl-prolyl cis-trans isomerase C